MLKSSIHSEVRNNLGSKESNRVRNNGYIPGIVYGYNIQPRTIKLDKREMNGILRDYGTNVLVDLEVDGQVITSMIKEIQRDTFNKEIIHIDFQSVSFDKLIHATVPISLVDRQEVEDTYATIQHQLREINIECLPQNLPENVQISVKDLSFGNPLKIGDVEFANEMTILNDPGEIIASLAKAGRVDDEEIEDKLITDNNFEPMEEE